MIKIPETYKNNIINMFGEPGEKWLNIVPNIVDKYVKKFNLKNIQILNDLTFNIIIFAECDSFGKIVFKVSLPNNELLIRETNALNKFNGFGACKCFYSNADDGIIIIERLEPGKTLHEVEYREDRIKEFCKVAKSLNNSLNEHIDLPSYRQILNRSIDASNQYPEKYQILKHYIEEADDLYQEIESMKLPIYLLHADLHHNNILSSGTQRKAIDPHGFIGERVMETARFLENEIVKNEINEESVLETIKMMSNSYEEDEELICKSLFIDYTLSTCWDIEVNTNKEHIINDINNLNIIKNVLKRIKSKTKSLTKNLI
ncbi:MAG: aminoglycoside phosphotransferase family protein [Tissierellia bacterium]|nr:aminoglycoside phosphotransferase family protein [Tissierellia bacterium]MDD4727045.1 aminoglycoside phosphotransferase family protein [Tissierellia bacterium]